MSYYRTAFYRLIINSRLLIIIATYRFQNTNSWKSKPSVATGFSSQAGAAAIGSTGGGGFKNGPTVLVTYDPFYSPILQKIDALFTQLGFNDEGCRERLICSMYKNPVRFSPHSNLLSTELSR